MENLNEKTMNNLNENFPLLSETEAFLLIHDAFHDPREAHVLASAMAKTAIVARKALWKIGNENQPEQVRNATNRASAIYREIRERTPKDAPKLRELIAEMKREAGIIEFWTRQILSNQNPDENPF